MHNLLLVFFVTIFSQFTLCRLVGNADPSNVSKATRENYCSRIESYDDVHVVPHTERVRVEYKTFCWSLTLSCTKHRYKTVTVNKTVTVRNTKRVYDCCPGYEKKKGTCMPTCKFGCGHGKCAEPDVCLCEPGWSEPFCHTECEPNMYGSGCKDKCTCLHEAECDKVTGLCHCTKGYTGNNCEFPCPKDTYGQDCENKCECKNDAVCDIEDGICECKPGYEGEYCEKPCENGTHGQDCEYECICFPETTESCHHVDGKCTCMAGYTGLFCERECENFTYGINCSEECDCLNSYFCNPVDGQCYCEPGWTGAECSEKCPIGTFGEDCAFECVECMNVSGICDPVTGDCNCPVGRYGEFCEKACLPGFWGSNCSNTCNCSENMSCDIHGECLSMTESYMYVATPYKMILSLCSAILIIALIGITCFFGYIKQRWLSSESNDNSSTISRLSRFVLNRKKQGFVISNPLYNSPVVILKSQPSEEDFARGSYPNGVKYLKTDGNDIDIQNNLTDVKISNVPEVKNKRDTKGLEGRKSQILSDLNAAFNGMKRCSIRKLDSTQSSTDQLDKDNDFQPEVLDDFSIIENIYEEPNASIIKNIYEKMDMGIIKNIYDKPVETKDESLTMK